MSVKADSAAFLPSLYGLSIAVPVVIAVFLLASGIEFTSQLQAFQRVGTISKTSPGC